MIINYPSYSLPYTIIFYWIEEEYKHWGSDIVRREEHKYFTIEHFSSLPEDQQIEIYAMELMKFNISGSFSNPATLYIQSEISTRLIFRLASNCENHCHTCPS